MARCFSQAVEANPAVEPLATTSSLPEGADASAEPSIDPAVDAVAPTSADASVDQPEVMSQRAFRNKVERAIKEKRYADVLAHFDAMLPTYKDGAAPHIEVLDAVLESKAVTEGVNAALTTLSLVTSQFPSLQAEASSYAAIMQACIAGGDSATVRSLYDSLLASGKSATHDIFNTMIVVYCATKDFDGAEQIFAEMREANIKPKRITYLRFINGCFKVRTRRRSQRACGLRHPALPHALPCYATSR